MEGLRVKCFNIGETILDVHGLNLPLTLASYSHTTLLSSSVPVLLVLEGQEGVSVVRALLGGGTTYKAKIAHHNTTCNTV